MKVRLCSGVSPHRQKIKPGTNFFDPYRDFREFPSMLYCNNRSCYSENKCAHFFSTSSFRNENTKALIFEENPRHFSLKLDSQVTVIHPKSIVAFFPSIIGVKLWRSELDQLLRILSRKLYVVSPLVSLSSMWLFLWLVDSSDASFCHSNPPHSGTDLHSPLPWNIVAHHAYMFHPHGGLEWHWVHVTHGPPDSAAA